MKTDEHILEMARQAASAARGLAGLDAETKNLILKQMAQGILQHDEAILTANALDLEAGRAGGLSHTMLDRLRLDHQRIEAMAEGLCQVARLPDPVGKELSVVRRPNGLIIRKVRVPLGVVAVIYESRPNVTADAAGLCFKAGNAAILRGGSEATHSNDAILTAMFDVVCSAEMPAHAVQLVKTTDHEAVHALLQLEQYIDLVIPRGGESLIRAVAEHSKVPVLKHYKGVCHVYVDRAADLDMALDIVINAKCQRPGVCNAMETLLVHEAIAEVFLPRVAQELISHGVELRGDERTCGLVAQAKSATPKDWSEEYLDLILAVGVVGDLDAAIDHIERYGTHHSDVIVTADDKAAQRFTHEVDSATVYVNASSRFTDGFEFGMGAEIGISTGKLHARGPCGLEELTTYKYVIQGTGQIRE